MKSAKPSGIFRPFENLKSMLENRSFPLPPSPADTLTLPIDGETDPETEKRQFLEAMAGVHRILCDRRIEKEIQIESPLQDKVEIDSDPEVLNRLDNLVKHGTGFSVPDTPEYMEGTGPGVPQSMINRLHRGDFSIQGYVDLHGLTVKDAKEAFDIFLQHSIKTEKRGVLVVHGRGLSSPSEPVLKGKVLEWLTRGTWRKWILAFSSARLCDGGAGASYVLLRKRPLTKSRMKKQRNSKK
jgi:DNA-nicking Smr family endonuclease